MFKFWEKRRHYYIVSYLYKTQNGIQGQGVIGVSQDKKIDTFAEKERMEEYIRNLNKFEVVGINNLVKLKG